VTVTKSDDHAPTLATAYAVKTPQDSIDLYGRWAKTYDKEFAEKNDYVNPRQIADAFAARATVENAPVLDVGAGTGLVGEQLMQYGINPVDAIDISKEMLEVAMAKSCYRTPIIADLTLPLDIPSNTYGGVVCAGTFTFGHVGAEAIDELIRIAKPNALFVLGINKKVYESAGFKAKFEEHAAGIRGFEILELQGYGERASSEMQASRSSVAVFWKRVVG